MKTPSLQGSQLDADHPYNGPHCLMKNVTEDYPPMTREAPPNLIGGVHGGTDQYGS